MFCKEKPICMKDGVAVRDREASPTHTDKNRGLSISGQIR